MAGTLKFLRKTPIDNLSNRCCWCYEFRLPKGMRRELYAIDLPEDALVGDPAHYSECNDYVWVVRDESSSDEKIKNVPEGKQLVQRKNLSDAGAEVIEFCFISSCKEGDEEMEISLHYWNDAIKEWSSIGFDGSKKVVGPAPISQASQEDELITTLAYYEGVKLSHLFSGARFQSGFNFPTRSFSAKLKATDLAQGEDVTALKKGKAAGRRRTG